MSDDEQMDVGGAGDDVQYEDYLEEQKCVSSVSERREGEADVVAMRTWWMENKPRVRKGKE